MSETVIYGGPLKASGAQVLDGSFDCKSFTGFVPIVALTTTTPAALTSTQVKGHLVTINQAATITLPACFVGACVTIYSTAANAVNVDADAGDRIVLNGTPLDNGDKITSASGAGDFVTLISDDADGWRVIGRSGTWTDGGA